MATYWIFHNKSVKRIHGVYSELTWTQEVRHMLKIKASTSACSPFVVQNVLQRHVFC